MFRVSARRGTADRFVPGAPAHIRRRVLPLPATPPTLVGMSSRTAGPDDARAIPQRGASGGDPDDTGEVYTVDVRGRRGSGARAVGGSSRPGRGAVGPEAA